MHLYVPPWLLIQPRQPHAVQETTSLQKKNPVVLFFLKLQAQAAVVQILLISLVRRQQVAPRAGTTELPKLESWLYKYHIAMRFLGISPGATLRGLADFPLVLADENSNSHIKSQEPSTKEAFFCIL